MTLAEAAEHDFIGAPKVHTNEITGLVTVRYHIADYDDSGSLDCVLSEAFTLII